MWVGTQFILCNNYFELLFRSEQATENYIQKIMIRKKTMIKMNKNILLAN